jgi:hypothetical protein
MSEFSHNLHVDGHGLDFMASRFLAVTTELADTRAKLAAVEALIVTARKISPGDRMCVYLTDVERALGLTDRAAPHKHGQNEAT